jgi:hypothetical protein
MSVVTRTTTTVGRLAKCSLYREYHIDTTPRAVQDVFAQFPGIAPLRLAVASLLAEPIAEGSVMCVLSMHPLSDDDLHLTTRAYLDRYPEDVADLSRLLLNLDRPILSHVGLAAVCKRGRYFPFTRLDNLIYTFGPRIQEQVDAHLAQISCYDDAGTYYGVERLLEEGGKLSPEVLVGRATPKFRIWLNDRVEEYRKIKVYLLIHLPNLSSWPQQLVQEILDYLPWSMNVHLDEMSMYLFHRLVRVEQQLQLMHARLGRALAAAGGR